MQKTWILIGALIVSLFSFGCMLDSEGKFPLPNVENSATSALYKVNIHQTEDTCRPNKFVKDRIDGWFWLSTVSQEQHEDGNYLIDITLYANYIWDDVNVSPEGNFSATREDSCGTFYYHIDGALSGESIIATVTIEATHGNENIRFVVCNMVYDVEGDSINEIGELAEPREPFEPFGDR